MDAFDADVLIYASTPEHPLCRRIRALFPPRPDALAGVGSVLLLPEVLAKPMREGSADEVAALAGLLGRLELRGADAVTAAVATTLAAPTACGPVHLATAVVAGADRFITNNRRAFPSWITEVDVTYPELLTES